MTEPGLVLHYAPRTRAFTALWLLEELGVPYRIEAFDLATGHHKTDAYRALNPMGKVPLVVEDGRPIAETGAIATYLADRYPAAGLAPAFDDPTRPGYLRWMFFAPGIVEPALGEKFFKWNVPASSVAWGSFDQMLSVVNDALTTGPWFMGDTFRACDVTLGATLRFGVLFGAIPKEGPVASYVSRLEARPAFQRAAALEVEYGARFPRKT